MLRKKQVVTIVCIAVASFLVGTIFNVTMATDGGNPFDAIWEAICGVESDVDNLNASLVELEGRVSELETLSQFAPRIMTAVGYPEWTPLESGVWIDLASVSNVVVSEGADAFAVASVNLRCTEVAYAPMSLRLRINDTYGEEIFQGFAHIFPPGNTERELVEFHHAWTNLPEGTYTFAVQCYVNPWRVIHIRQSRLTLLIT